MGGEGSLLGGFREFGQGDFSVRVTQLDRSKHSIVARTLGGHPLAGWRKWQISQLSNGELLLETFSVEHPFSNGDTLKMAIGGNSDMSQTWRSYLTSLANKSKGTMIIDSSTALEGRVFSHTEALSHLPEVDNR